MNDTFPSDYPRLLDDIKQHIRTAQVKANLSINRELILLYWEIGHLIVHRQQIEGWGAGVIPRLSRDLNNELPGVKGFSVRNIKRMTRFYREYPTRLHDVPPASAKLQECENIVIGKVPQPAAQLSKIILGIPWFHHVILFEKIQNMNERIWYMQKTIEHGWSRNILAMQIKNNTYGRSAKAVTNFELTLPEPQSELATQALKDPYIFDFLTLDMDYREKELETGLVNHLERFLLELGAGFAFLGRQVHLEVEEEDFYIDLLFYHIKLHCFVAIELKRGKFKPEYVGKMNFYLNAVDNLMRSPDDKPSLGLILCQERKRIVAEYTLGGMTKPMGVSEYEVIRTLPEEYGSNLPTIEDIEKELSKSTG